jgi:phage/plasmid-like protein (TIGR03299 family)
MTTTATRKTDSPSYSPDSRQAPWDVMGGDLQRGHKSVAAGLEATGLDYQVEMRALYGADANGLPLEAKHLRTVVRPMPDGTEKVLAATGTRFTPIQNAAAFAPAQYLVDEFGATITGLCDFRGGGASLLVLAMPKGISLTMPNGGTEVLDLNLLTKNAHDGTSALTFALTVMRPACTNALPGALREAKRAWKISHTPNAEGRVEIARQAIIASMNYADAFQAQAQAMMDQPMVDREFDKMVERLWKVEADKADTKAGQNRLEVQEAVKTLYRTSETLEGVRGTRWGGYNAVTEYLDWGRPVRGGEVSRAEGALEGPYVRTKAKVWEQFAMA